MAAYLRIRSGRLSAIAALATFVLLVGQAIGEDSQRHNASGDDCGCPGCHAYFDAVEGGVSGIGEATAPGQASSTSPLSESSLLASNFGATAGAAGAVPSMIGDFFGNNYKYAFTNPNGTTVATAGGAQRLKYAENTNPFPTDRIFFNYHYFEDPLLDMDGRPRDVNQFTFGLEKSFCDELFSVEFRVPFAGALNSEQSFADSNAMATEFGNMSLAAKVLVYQNDCTAVATGLGMVFPTGQDSVVSDDESTVIVFENSSMFLQPFVGIYGAPTERLFHQFVAQVDFDVNGSNVIIPPNSFLARDNSTVSEISRLHGQTLLYLDYQVGYWLYRNSCASVVTGVAPLLELHYNSTLQNLDLGQFGTSQRGPSRGIFVEELRRDVLNLTSGVHLELFQSTSLKLAAVVPLLEDRIFDYELGLQLTHRY
ncbi:MAG: hypothetical protein ACYC3X_01935 [Pirellulaceae bacterium]